jgi:hypothetical protein
MVLLTKFVEALPAYWDPSVHFFGLKFLLVAILKSPTLMISAAGGDYYASEIPKTYSYMVNPFVPGLPILLQRYTQ